jgi:hypothetical protein
MTVKLALGIVSLIAGAVFGLRGVFLASRFRF